MRFRLLSFAISTAFVSGAIHADETVPDRREAPVIVTAAGPSRAASELISHASVLAGNDLTAALAPSLGDTLAGLPGAASTSFGQGASRPVLRGLGAERVQVLTNGLGVIDVSAVSPDHQVTADGIDAEAIEILRGPAAFAYGGQAIGGVVNVRDGLIAETAPTAPYSGRALAAYNSVSDGFETGARVQIARAQVVATFIGSARDLGNYDIPGFAETDALRAQVPVSAADPATASGSVANSYVETRALGAGFSLVGERGFAGIAVRKQSALYGIPGEGGDVPEGEGPFIDLDQTRYELRAGFDTRRDWLGAINAGLVFADYTHTEFEAPGEPGTKFDADGLEGRLEAETKFAGGEGVVGVQFANGDLAAAGDEAFISDTETERRGIFAYHVIENDSGAGIEAGLRSEQVDYDNVISGARQFDVVGVSAGVHRHTGPWFAGVQISYAERAPSPTELFADGPHLATGQFEIGNPDARAEQGLTGEGRLGFETTTLSASLSLFASQFDDFIFLSPTGAVVDDLPVFQVAQSAADFSGGEFSLAWRPASAWSGARWTLGGSVDVVSAELGSGEPVPFLPPATLRINADAAWSRLRAGIDAEFAAAQDEPGAGQTVTAGYTALDALIAYRLDGLGFARAGTEIFLQVRNLADEDVRRATSVLKDIAPQPGRNIRIGLTAAF
jgi:iron complex outermembrane recepter protein